MMNSSPSIRTTRRASADRLERRIARRISVAIVNQLEPVEVEIDERRAHALAFHIAERALAFALEAAPVDSLSSARSRRLERRHAALRGGIASKRGADPRSRTAAAKLSLLRNHRSWGEDIRQQLG
jgi:hypothetical protein